MKINSCLAVGVLFAFAMSGCTKWTRSEKERNDLYVYYKNGRLNELENEKRYKDHPMFSVRYDGVDNQGVGPIEINVNEAGDMVESCLLKMKNKSGAFRVTFKDFERIGYKKYKATHFFNPEQAPNRTIKLALFVYMFDDCSMEIKWAEYVDDRNYEGGYRMLYRGGSAGKHVSDFLNLEHNYVMVKNATFEEIFD